MFIGGNSFSLKLYYYIAPLVPIGSFLTAAVHSCSCASAVELVTAGADAPSPLLTHRFNGIKSSESDAPLKAAVAALLSCNSFFCAAAAVERAAKPLPAVLEVECEGATGTGRCLLPTAGCWGAADTADDPLLAGDHGLDSLAVCAGKGLLAGDVMAHINNDDWDFWWCDK